MPCCAWPARRFRKMNRPISSNQGAACVRMTSQIDGPCSALTSISTFSDLSAGNRAGSPKSGTRVLKRSDVCVWLGLLFDSPKPGDGTACGVAEGDARAEAEALALAPGWTTLLVAGLKVMACFSVPVTALPWKLTLATLP